MNKYVELPAFETNEFNKGDYIRVYLGGTCGWQPHDVLIISVAELSVEVIIDEVRYFVPFQACRKLEEIKPREFWVLKEEHRKETCLQFILDEPRSSCMNYYIKVREVLDGE